MKNQTSCNCKDCRKVLRKLKSLLSRKARRINKQSLNDKREDFENKTIDNGILRKYNSSWE